MSVGMMLLAGVLAAGPEPAVAQTLARYEAARPTAEALRFYSLDWASDLTEAKARAKKEGRPIFFVMLTNITASTRFFSGHC